MDKLLSERMRRGSTNILTILEWADEAEQMERELDWWKNIVGIYADWVAQLEAKKADDQDAS